MKKAFALDSGNADIVEQHSIIVGDYEDSITNSEFEAALNAKSMSSETKDANAGSLLVGSSSIEELRFALELFKKIDEQATSITEEQHQNQIQDAWIAYDLLLPFVERNEHVRAKFRTTGEMDKLCNRIVTALSLPALEAVIDNSCQLTEDAITSAMINCAAAAVTDTPRNQVVMFRHVDFRKMLLSSFGSMGKIAPSAINKMSWLVHASIIRFLEQAIDSKSWRNAIASSEEGLMALFAGLALRTDTANLSIDEKSSKMAISLAASSICFTLSSESAGIQTFTGRGSECITVVTQALEINRRAKSVDTLRNLLGFLTNLSTDSTTRRVIEGNNCEETRRKLVQILLQISDGEYSPEKAKSTISKDHSCSERALGALLNLSFHEASQIRTHDLLEFGAVNTIERILNQARSAAFSDLILVLSRAVSLLCRLHSSRKCENAGSEDILRCFTSQNLLSKLYTVCESANSCFSDKVTAIPYELWQLCAQIWCHFGWCAHLPNVRGFLREKNAVPLLIQVVALANAQKAYHRSTGETTACERLAGNIVKVLIAMESDHDPDDGKAFRSKNTLTVLVKTLQDLHDGLARKNVAILLAKLCQSDSRVKSTVRELRGIEMMLSVSQSLKQCPAVLSR
ncbi:unnamed protein product [Phytophthora fragariaefolia]|uniref:Unnamed protein product n=1 Tax=Phytophthora fragariaefolia TaxID=1490495 RepID=A0A9W6YQE9_9STRA|nr:unnamed protein product [Phytophthora fragariaefolia]